MSNFSYKILILSISACLLFKSMCKNFILFKLTSIPFFDSIQYFLLIDFSNFINHVKRKEDTYETELVMKNINTWLIPGMFIALLSQSLIKYENRSNLESEPLRMALKIIIIIIITIVGAKTAFNIEIMPKPKIDVDEFDDYELVTETLLKPLEEQKELKEVEKFLNKDIK